MSKRSIKNIILLLIFIAYIISYKFVIFNNYMKYAEIASASFMVLLLALGIKLLGFRKDKKTPLAKNIFRVVAIYLVLTFLVMYGLGFGIGFLKNAYSLSFFTLLDNIFAPIIIIILVELFRYVVIWANKDKKRFIVLFTIVIIIFELVLNVSRVDYTNLKEMFSLTATIILPVIIKNIILSYLCYHVGYKVTLLYRLVMDVYVFVVPIIPNLGDYINSMILVSLPMLIYITSYGFIDERDNKVKPIFTKKMFSLWDIPVAIVFIAMIVLISGLFPHYMIGVGSDSMSPKVNKGDAVILKKVNDKTVLKKGDIIAYNKDGKIIIHRIVKIETDKKGKEVYTTKGDANGGNDPKLVKRKKVDGVVKLKVPFIAYPTIWLSEFMNK